MKHEIKKVPSGHMTFKIAASDSHHLWGVGVVPVSERVLARNPRELAESKGEQLGVAVIWLSAQRPRRRNRYKRIDVTANIARLRRESGAMKYAV